MGLDVNLCFSLDWDESIRRFESEDDVDGIRYYEAPSFMHDDHHFKIGYFRSSYSPNGFNDIMRKLGLQDMYDIFEVHDDHEYFVKIDWKKAEMNVRRAIEEFKKHVKTHRDEKLLYGLEIIEETVGFVLSRKDSGNWRLAWSA